MEMHSVKVKKKQKRGFWGSEMCILSPLLFVKADLRPLGKAIGIFLLALPWLRHWLSIISNFYVNALCACTTYSIFITDSINHSNVEIESSNPS